MIRMDTTSLHSIARVACMHAGRCSPSDDAYEALQYSYFVRVKSKYNKYFVQVAKYCTCS